MDQLRRRVGPAHPGALTPGAHQVGEAGPPAPDSSCASVATAAGISPSLRRIMLGMRHIAPGVYWDARHDSTGPSRSPVSPVSCWQRGHLRRLLTTVSLALLVVLASAAGVPLSFVTIQPPIPPGSGARYVKPTLLALRQLTRQVRELSSSRGYWGRIVGTINVVITNAGDARWSALPHAHLVMPTALVESVRTWWSTACSDLKLPDTSPDAARPAVHAVPLGTSPADIAAVSSYLQQATWARRTERPGQPLAAVAREGGALADRGDPRGPRMLRRWRCVVAAIRYSGVMLGLGRVIHRSLMRDARDVVRILQMGSWTAAEDQEAVAAQILKLIPHYREGDGGLPHALIRLRDEQRVAASPNLAVQAEVARERDRIRSQERRCAIARLRSSMRRSQQTAPDGVRGISCTRCVHPETASVPFEAVPRTVLRTKGTSSEPAEPRARSPPTPHASFSIGAPPRPGRP